MFLVPRTWGWIVRTLGALKLSSWAKHCTIVVSLFTKVYKLLGWLTWINNGGGGDMRCTPITLRASGKTRNRVMLRKPALNQPLLLPISIGADFTFYHNNQVTILNSVWIALKIHASLTFFPASFKKLVITILEAYFLTDFSDFQFLLCFVLFENRSIKL